MLNSYKNWRINPTVSSEIDSAYPNLSSLLTEINLRSKGYFRNLKVEVKQSLVEYPVYFGLFL